MMRQIVEVDNQSIVWWNVKEVSALFHGPAGSLVKLGFVKTGTSHVQYLLVRSEAGRGLCRLCSILHVTGLV